MRRLINNENHTQTSTLYHAPLLLLEFSAKGFSFFLDPNGENRPWSRAGGSSGEVSADDFQRQLLSDEQKREKMVEDMITMTREWKEQSKIANKIIKKDIDVSMVLFLLFNKIRNILQG